MTLVPYRQCWDRADSHHLVARADTVGAVVAVGTVAAVVVVGTAVVGVVGVVAGEGIDPRTGDIDSGSLAVGSLGPAPSRNDCRKGAGRRGKRKGSLVVGVHRRVVVAEDKASTDPEAVIRRSSAYVTAAAHRTAAHRIDCCRGSSLEAGTGLEEDSDLDTVGVEGYSFEAGIGSGMVDNHHHHHHRSNLGWTCSVRKRPQYLEYHDDVALLFGFFRG